MECKNCPIARIIEKATREKDLAKFEKFAKEEYSPVSGICGTLLMDAIRSYYKKVNKVR